MQHLHIWCQKQRGFEVKERSWFSRQCVWDGSETFLSSQALMHENTLPRGPTSKAPPTNRKWLAVLSHQAQTCGLMDQGAFVGQGLP